MRNIDLTIKFCTIRVGLVHANMTINSLTQTDMWFWKYLFVCYYLQNREKVSAEHTNYCKTYSWLLEPHLTVWKLQFLIKVLVIKYQKCTFNLQSHQKPYWQIKFSVQTSSVMACVCTFLQVSDPWREHKPSQARLWSTQTHDIM